MPNYCKRLALFMTTGVALIPLCGGWAGDKKNADKNQFYQGNVVPLADFLAKAKIKIDADAAPYQLSLQTEDGKLHPLIKDEGSRMFFTDVKLLKRPMRLTVRAIPNSPFLQVINVHSIVKGKLHDVYYWCEVCQIKRFEAGICDCCGDAMVFREEPAKVD
jgi:hypothetical protein